MKMHGHSVGNSLPTLHPPTSQEYVNTTHEKEIIVDENFSKIAQLNQNNNAHNLYFNC